jgi:hypothetical protein
MTCIAFASNDAYEIYYDDFGVSCILRYRHGLDSAGEAVDYDSLSPQVQQAIYSRLKRALAHHANHNHNSSFSSPKPSDSVLDLTSGRWEDRSESIPNDL